MKVVLNLSTSVDRGERFALAWAVPALLVGLAGLFFLAGSTVRALREYGRIHRSVTELQERETRLRARELAVKRDLEQPQFRQVFREVQFVNSLIERKQLTLTTLAARITKLLPPEVRLSGLALVQQLDGSYLVRIVVTGRSEEAVEALLGNLEDSPDFKDVAITNQGFAQEGAAAGPVNVTCTARYLPEER